MTTTKQYIADAMSAMLNNDTDRALGLLMRASLAYDDAISRSIPVAEPLAQAVEDLPPITPVNGGRKVRASETRCPTCGAKPGKPCKRMTARGRNGKPTSEPLMKNDKLVYHHRRYEQARGAGTF